MVFDLEPEHEVEQVVVPDRGPGLLFENLGRDLPDVDGDPAADQQRHHVVVGGLANAVVADRTGEGVRRQRSVGADVEADLGGRQLDLTTAWAGCADRRHTVASLSPAEPPPRAGARCRSCSADRAKSLTGGAGIDSAPASLSAAAVSYTHLRAHETRHDLVCRLLLEKK